MAARKPTKKTTKKRASRAKPTPPPPLSEKVLATVVRQLVMDGNSDDEVRAKNRGDERIDEYIAEARRRLAIMAQVDREAEIGMGIARMHTVFAIAIATDHPSAAVAAQAQISKLLALYPKEPKGDGSMGADQLDELQQIEQHLRPLGLGPEGYPLVELARLAAERIRELGASHGDG